MSQSHPSSKEVTSERASEVASQLGKCSARHPACDQTKYWAWEGALYVRSQAEEIERLMAYLRAIRDGADTGASHAWFRGMANGAILGDAIMVGDMGALRRLGPRAKL